MVGEYGSPDEGPKENLDAPEEGVETQIWRATGQHEGGIESAESSVDAGRDARRLCCRIA
ncbi:hypothetical protein PF003_g39786 [Phytophthora fragariae]|nr:hypothetical protein PF003_g39786 [Phytophthora fragariae]